MKAIKYIGFGVLVVLVVAAGTVIVNGSAEYRTQQESKTITIHISSSAPPGE